MESVVRTNSLLAHADRSSDNEPLFWHKPDYLRNDRAKEGMMIMIIITLIIVIVL